MDLATKRYQGTVKAFDRFDGAGTIALPDGREIPVRYSAIRGQGVRSLRQGDMVSFMLQETPRGLCAVCVQQE
ncbi:MAG: cold shock domain-containing protein [Chloroflexi bacterium]|nr:cold shock domain-containing protein [Chloroflexota bacterium]